MPSGNRLYTYGDSINTDGKISKRACQWWCRQRILLQSIATGVKDCFVIWCVEKSVQTRLNLAVFKLFEPGKPEHVKLLQYSPTDLLQLQIWRENLPGPMLKD